MNVEATQSTRLYEFLAWVIENKKRLLIVGSAVTAVGVGLYLYVWQQDQKELAASQALSELRAPLGPAGRLQPVAAEAYLKIAAQYPGTSAGARALLMGAGGLFNEGKYPEARSEFERFLREYSEHSFAGHASLGVATCLDAQDKIAEAIAKYQEVAARFASEPAVSHPARLALARLQETQKKPEEAFKIYVEMARAQPPTTWSDDARFRMEALLKTHPQLAATLMTRTNAPAPVRTNVLAPPTTNSPRLILATNPPPAVVRLDTNPPIQLKTNAAGAKR